MARGGQTRRYGHAHRPPVRRLPHVPVRVAVQVTGVTSLPPRTYEESSDSDAAAPRVRGHPATAALRARAPTAQTTTTTEITSNLTAQTTSGEARRSLRSKRSTLDTPASSAAATPLPTTLDLPDHSSTLPNEVLAYTFLFVRGHLASGGLAAARLTCQRWREIIDAHVPIVASREPHRTAYAFGYGTPLGIMPSVNDALKRLREVFVRAVESHNAVLYCWVRNHAKSLLSRGDYTKFKRDLEDERYAVAVGIWEDIGAVASPENAPWIHGRDLCRVSRETGVAVDDHWRMLVLRRDGKRASHFQTWSDDEIRRALVLFEREGVNFQPHAALPWLMRRGFIGPRDIERHFIRVLVYYVFESQREHSVEAERARIRRCAHKVLDEIERLQWVSPLSYKTLTQLFRTKGSWPLLQRVLRLCPQTVQATVWRPSGFGTDLIEFINEELHGPIGEHLLRGVATAVSPAYASDPIGARESRATRAIAALNWLEATLNCYRNATVEDTNGLLGYLVSLQVWHDFDDNANAGRDRITVRMLEWLLPRLPAPSATRAKGIMVHVDCFMDYYRGAELAILTRYHPALFPGDTPADGKVRERKKQGAKRHK